MGRTAGIGVKPTKQTADEDARAIVWTAADFIFGAALFFPRRHSSGFPRGCQDLVSSLLHKDAQTVLVVSNRPSQPHLCALKPSALHLGRDHVEWTWREKAHAIGVEKIAFDLQEIPEIAEERHVSTLLTRKGELRLQAPRKVKMWPTKMWKIQEEKR